MGYVWRLKRGAGNLRRGANVTAHSLTGRRRRRSVCGTRNPHDTVSSLSTTPSRAVARTHALPPAFSRVISLDRARDASTPASSCHHPQSSSRRALRARRGVNFRPRAVPERLCETRKPSVYPRGVYSVVHAAGVNVGSLACRKCLQFAFIYLLFWCCVPKTCCARVCAEILLGKARHVSHHQPTPTPTPTPVGGCYPSYSFVISSLHGG